MTEERRRILNLMKDGKISVEEADDLLAALDGSKGPSSPPCSPPANSPGPDLRYFRVQVEPKGGYDRHHRRHRLFGKNGKVNVRIPLAILRAGIKLTTLLPQDASARIDEELNKNGIGLGLSDLEGAKLEPLIEALSQNPIDVDTEDSTVKIYCE